MKCRLCDRNAHQCRGWLQRVNEKGQPGIFECRPHCDTIISRNQALTGAILGHVPDPNAEKSE